MKKITLSAVSILAAVTLAGCSAGDNVATVGDSEIAKDEFYETMKATIGETTLQRMILIEALENEVGENTFAADAEADARTTMASVGGEEAFLGLLQQMGFTSVKEYQDQIHLNSLMNAALEERTPVTDEEIAEYYETYDPSSTITASHILVEDKALAEDLIKQINEGADFAELAMEHSTDGSAQSGGSLGQFGKGQMVAPFEEAAFALEEGEMTQEPVESEHGFHIIKVTEKPVKGTLEEETENIKALITSEKLADAVYLDEAMTSIMKDADIKINDEDLKDVMDPFLGVTEEAPENAESGETAETTESAEPAESTESTESTESAE